MAKKTQKALIIVDVQNDFCPGGKLPVPNGNEVVPLLNKMARQARKNSRSWWIYASLDTHPKKTSHFDKWPAHCIKDTKGADFHPDLDTMGAIFVLKGTKKGEDAYSAFDGHTMPNDLSLEDSLKNKDVSKVYIGGLATDYCVKATALDALKLGFKVYLLLDACRAVNIKPDDGEKAVEKMKKAGAVITSVKEVLGDEEKF